MYEIYIYDLLQRSAVIVYSTALAFMVAESVPGIPLFYEYK